MLPLFNAASDCLEKSGCEIAKVSMRPEGSPLAITMGVRPLRSTVAALPQAMTMTRNRSGRSLAGAIIAIISTQTLTSLHLLRVLHGHRRSFLGQSSNGVLPGYQYNYQGCSETISSKIDRPKTKKRLWVLAPRHYCLRNVAAPGKMLTGVAFPLVLLYTFRPHRPGLLAPH